MYSSSLIFLKIFLLSTAFLFPFKYLYEKSFYFFVDSGTTNIPVNKEKRAIIKDPIMYSCNILLIDTPDEYKAIISELDDNFEVNHVIAKKRNKGNKLEEK